jgi:DNA-binding winged helix-turn-helix (wHTH) protein/TolB-like protein
VSRIRFGVFAFDPASRELTRDGIPVRLQPQPLQVLAMLLEHAGEVVTRDQLRKAVWGSDTFVEFDGGLNYCIAQIRAALGDCADSPRYIRTVPKRGYQFVAPTALPPEPTRNRRRDWPAVGLAIAALALMAFLLYPKPPAVNIAVTRFDNETGLSEMSAFADGLTDTVVADLTVAAGRRYGIIGNAALLRLPREERNLAAIASSLRAGYVILGQVQHSAGRIRVLAHLIRLPEQTHVWVVRRDLDIANALQSESEIGRMVVSEFLLHLGFSPNAATR